MNVLKSNRWFLLSGILFVVLTVYIGIPKGELVYLPESEAVSTFYKNRADLFYIQGYLGVLSGLFLLIFVNSICGLLKELGPQLGMWPNMAFSGGVTASTLALAGYSIQQPLADRANTVSGINPETAVVMHDILSILTYHALPVAFALFVGATGIVLIRTKLLPTWFGWVSVILALGLASPLMYLVMTGGLIWTIVVSVWLFARFGHEAQPMVEAATSSY